MRPPATFRQIDRSELQRYNVSQKEAEEVVLFLRNHETTYRSLDASEVWSLLSQQFLGCKRRIGTGYSWDLHRALFDICYASWTGLAPPPIWIPAIPEIYSTNAYMLYLKLRDMGVCKTRRSVSEAWNELYNRSVDAACAHEFWTCALAMMRVQFKHSPRDVVENWNASYPDSVRWFPGSEFNIALGCLQVTDEMSGSAPAILAAKEEAPKSIEVLTRDELKDSVKVVAYYLYAQGLRQGVDRVAIIMPMCIEGTICFLSVVAMGCAVVSIAESFSPNEIAARLQLAQVSLIVTQYSMRRSGKEIQLYKKIIAWDNAPPCLVVCRDEPIPSLCREKDSFLNLKALRHAFAKNDLGFESIVSMNPNLYSNILFSSGTTGQAKVIPWNHINCLRPVLDCMIHQDIHRGDVACWPTSYGWMMGPYIVYGTLHNGGILALFEGSPTSAQFGEFVEAAKVTMLGVIPSIVRAWRNTACMDGLDWSNIRCFSSTGEASTASEYAWLSSLSGYKAPVIEYCGGTELSGGYMSGSLLQPQASGYFSTPTLGSRPYILTETDAVVPVPCSGVPHDIVTVGEILLRMPMLGASQQLLNADHYTTYFHGIPETLRSLSSIERYGVLRKHGDIVRADRLGYVRAEGRADDTMNLGGIKVSSAQIERVIIDLVSGVEEVAAVAESSQGPDRLVLFIVAQKQDERTLKMECQQAISTSLNPLFRIHSVHRCQKLPRTATNKIMRRLLRQRLEGNSKL